MNGCENEAPVRTEDMKGSDGKVPFKSRKSKDRSGNGNGTCQRADHGEEKKDVQHESDGACEVVPAFSQTFVPCAVQAGVQQKDDSQKHSQPFVDDASRVRCGHE